MENIADFMKRASEKTGFVREMYIENKLPATYSNIAILPFFGDQRAQFVLASLLLHKYIKLSSKYTVLCSWPGQAGFYPHVNEYWSIKDENVVEALAQKTKGFSNTEPKALFYERSLNRYFENVLSADVFDKYYNCGFTPDYFQEFDTIEYKLPAKPSIHIEFAQRLGDKKGIKVFLMPFKTITGWRRGKEETFICRQDFWEHFIKRLLENGFIPVVCQGFGTYDLSKDFVNDCVFVRESKILDIFAIMRAVGCVVDMFRGVSRLAIAARCPFIACVEKELYYGVKDYELDDLCGENIPRNYIFSFTAMIESGNWHELVDTIIARLASFIPSLNRSLWPTTSEISEVVPYTRVRDKKAKLLGTHLIMLKK